MAGEAAAGWRDATDRRHLERALELAERGLGATRPNPLVGAVLARRGSDVSIAEGWHARLGGPHGERAALDQLAEVPTDATLYVTLEPCAHHGRQPPCADLLLERGVRRVVIASRDPNPLTAGLGPAVLAGAGVEVVWAPADLQAAAMHQNRGFHCVHLRHRPWVTWKWAMTANGRLATGDPDERWISGAASRERVQWMRAASGAILVGVGTVLADDPRLTVRGSAAAGMVAPPVRVVADRALRTPPDGFLARSAREVPTVVVCSQHAATESAPRLEEAGVEIWRAPSEEGMLQWLLTRLAERNVNDVLLESGPALASSLHAAGLVDELACFRSEAVAAAGQPGLAPDHPLLLALAGASQEPVDGDTLLRRVLNPLPVGVSPRSAAT